MKLLIFPLQGNGISYLKIQKLCSLFTDHRTLISQLIGLSCKTVSQCHILPEGFHIFRYIEINTDIGFPVGSCNLTELNVCKPFQFFIFVQIFHQLLSVLIRSVLIRNNGSVIVLKLRILFHYNIRNRIPDAKAYQHQRHASGNTEYCHKQTLFVAEKVSEA